MSEEKTMHIESLNPSLNQLSHKEELLLIKYIDNECGILEKYLAKRLIAVKKGAREFVEAMSALSGDVSESQIQFQNLEVDLWPKIAQRIEQEEKAEFYLGVRESREDTSSIVTLWDFARVNLSMSGGLVAAALVLFFVYGVLPDSFFKGTERDLLVASEDSMSTQNVSLVAMQKRPTAKLDWVKSQGRVKMIRESERQLPIIWVNRSLPTTRPAPSINLPSLPNMSFSNRKPSLDLFDVGLDNEPPLTRDTNRSSSLEFSGAR